MTNLEAVAHMSREDLTNVHTGKSHLDIVAADIDAVLDRAQIRAGELTLPKTPDLSPEFQALLDLAINS